MVLDNMACKGGEGRLTDCNHHDVPNCYAYETQYVQCDITALGPPKDPVLFSGSDQSALVWNTPASHGGSPVVSYEYRYQGENGTFTEWVNVGRNLMASVPTPADGADYFYEVRAVNEAGAKASASYATGIITGFTLLDAATGRDLLIVSNGQTVTLGDHGAQRFDVRVNIKYGSDFDSMKISLTGDSFSRSRTVNEGHQTNLGPWRLLSGGQAPFVPQGNYKISATVYSDSNLRGTALDTVDIDFQLKHQKPDAPRRLLAHWSGGQVALDWLAPESDGGARITGYDYRYKVGSGNFSDWADAGSDLSVDLASVTDGAANTYEVRANNEVGYGAEASLTTPVAPSAPESLTWSVSGTDATLSWTVPPHNGGAAISRYDYRYWEIGQSVGAWTDGGADLTETVSGLTAGSDYIFEVRAVNTADAGPGRRVGTKTVAGFTLVNASNNAYLLDLSDGTTVALADHGTNSFTIRANLVSGLSIGSMRMVLTGRRSHTQSENWKPFFLYGDDGPGDPYGKSLRVGSYRLVATAYSRTGLRGDVLGTLAVNFTVVQNAPSAPAAPRKLMAHWSGGRVTLDWLAPESNGGARITGYDYRYKVGSGNFSDWADAGSDLSVDLASVTDGAANTYEVRANNEVGYGAEASLTTPVVPTEPLSLTVTRGSQIQELDASWQAPASNGGSTVTSYKLQWKEAADSWDTAANVSEATVTGTTHTITALAGGVEYAVRVMATNGAGDGAASTETAGTPAGGVSEQNVESENSAPTGLPVITGTFQADAVLTADTAAIDDANGLTGVSYSYQWILATDGTDADIEGATASTYTPRAAHVGRTFKVRVSFTDDDDYQHTLTSEPTTPITKPADATVWSADMLVVEYSDISIGAASADLFSNIGGAGSLQIRSLWSYRPDDDLRLAFTEGFDDADDHTLIVGDLTLEFPEGSSGNASFKWANVGVDWEDGQTIAVSIVPTTPAEPVANTAATGEPTISGTPQVGERLTADTSAISDADGLDDVSYNYQWLADDANIQHATGSTHTLTDDEEGKTIKVKVSFTDDAGNAETLTSQATTAVAPPPNRPATGAPSIQGVLQDQQALSADTVGIADADGLENATISYQWMRVADGDAVDITGATGSTYTLTSTDVGDSIQIQVAFTDDRDNTESITSAVTASVIASGATRELLWLSTMTPEDPDGLDTDFNFDSVTNQGSLSPAAFTDGDDTRAITFLGASFGSNTTLALELGSEPTTAQTATWRLELHDTELAFADATMTQTGASPPAYRFQWDATAQAVDDTDLWDDGDAFTVSLLEAINLSATGVPTIDGTPQVNETLTAAITGIADGNGLDGVSYAYQWTAGGSNIDGATSSSLTLTSSQESQTIQVRVSFNDDDGFSETATSVASEPVAAAEQANNGPTGLPSISGTPQVDQTLTADTSDIDDADGLTNVSYIYQWLAAGTAISGATGSSYTLTASQQGQTIQVRVDFEDDEGNSESLTSVATGPVEANTASLTASFSNVPSSHDGSAVFTFRVLFSEDVGISYVNMRDDAFSLDDGDVTGARRVDGRHDLWEITVEPDDNSDVVITLPANRACTTAGAICTREDTPRQLTNSPSATVPGPSEQSSSDTTEDTAEEPTVTSQLSVANATASEDDDATIDFVVTLNPAGEASISVDYATANGTASAGSDYTAQSGTLTFAAGETTKTVTVAIIDDTTEENDETLTLTLSNPSGAEISDGLATGTITDSEPAPLTASFSNVPDSHDGSAEFTFDLTFSENFPLSYRTLRDHAFTKDAQNEDHIVAAQRKVQGSSQTWTIKVQPAGNGAITITLPATTDCNATGAICTDDGRKLSNSNSVSISGPS